MSDQAQALSAQNQARQLANAQHGGNRPDLVWDDKLAADAQNWANHMASVDSLDHDPNAGEGENIANYGGTLAVASLMGGVTQWLGEVSRYNGEVIGQTGPGGTYEDWGHYTQIIWPTTTNVGVAVAQASSGAFYVCGRYSPTGNAQGQSAWTTNTTQGDAIYLVNSVKNGQWTSGFAYYQAAGNNDGQQPTKYVDIDTSGTVTWEGGSFSGTFNDDTSFSVSVSADGQTVAAGTAVGSGQDSAHGFTVYKDTYRVLYVIDGWQVYTVYRCV